MRVLLAVVGIVLAAPVLILVAIAFGPVALLILALVATALVVTGIWEWLLDSNSEPPVSPA
jgi:hypothetical protein